MKAFADQSGYRVAFPESLHGLHSLSELKLECPDIPRQLADLTNLEDIELHDVQESAENEEVGTIIPHL